MLTGSYRDFRDSMRIHSLISVSENCDSSCSRNFIPDIYTNRSSLI